MRVHVKALVGLMLLPCVVTAANATWPFSDDTITIENNISVASGTEEGPEFERTYQVSVPRSIRMKVTIKMFLGSLMYQGELTQPDGRWVIFEPERPADKILDREILPEVERLCQFIIAYDQKWRNSKPAEFTDRFGVRWRRQN